MIRILHEQSERYRHDAELWKKLMFHMSQELARIASIARDGMWYPSSYYERGEDGVSEQEKRWCEVQNDRTPA